MNHRLFHNALAGSVHRALAQLLCNKHLYQFVDVNLEPLLEVSKAIEAERRRTEPTMSLSAPAPMPSSVPEILAMPGSVANLPWPITSSQILGKMSDIVMVELPSINTYCSTCKVRPPFNPVYEMSGTVLMPGRENYHWYHLAYQCQQCKGIPVHFLVRREGLKLKLAGRDPLEAIPPPKVLPKAQAKFFGDAQIA